ncbi:hypothetical protein AAXE64_27820 [Priestia megaterium]
MKTTLEQQVEAIQKKIQDMTKGYVTYVHVSEVFELEQMMNQLKELQQPEKILQ